MGFGEGMALAATVPATVIQEASASARFCITSGLETSKSGNLSAGPATLGGHQMPHDDPGTQPVNSPSSGKSSDSDNPYEQLFDANPISAVVSRLSDHRVLAINERAAQLIGIPQNEASGLAVTDYYVD